MDSVVRNYAPIRVMVIGVLLMLIAFSMIPALHAQEPVEGESIYSKHGWVASGIFSPDFYPFPFNSRDFYNTNWRFNYTTGVLVASKISEQTYLGAGLLFSQKDHEQELSCDTCTLNFNTQISTSSLLRYVEIPIVIEHLLLRDEKTSLQVNGGIVTSLVSRYYTEATHYDGSVIRNPTNNDYYARFLIGLKGGFGINHQISRQYSAGVHPHLKIIFNDLSHDYFLNLSSMGISIRLNYHFD